ncbi:MAG: hypothetical protein RL264_1153 [Bacteroidota bacterium]
MNQKVNEFYINKEFIELDDVVNYKDLNALVNTYKSTLRPKGKFYLFIDEVQYIEQWERLINSYAQNFTESYELFITGSNSKMLSGELATLLSGRYITIDVFPFGYKEFTDFHQLENNKETYVKYLETGGLPGLFILPNDET